MRARRQSGVDGRFTAAKCKGLTNDMSAQALLTASRPQGRSCASSGIPWVPPPVLGACACRTMLVYWIVGFSPSVSEPQHWLRLAEYSSPAGRCMAQAVEPASPCLPRWQLP